MDIHPQTSVPASPRRHEPDYVEITTRSFFRGFGWSLARELVRALVQGLKR